MHIYFAMVNSLCEHVLEQRNYKLYLYLNVALGVVWGQQKRREEFVCLHVSLSVSPGYYTRHLFNCIPLPLLYKSLCFTCPLCSSSCLLPSRRSAGQGCLGRRCAPFLTAQTWLASEKEPLLLRTEEETVSAAHTVCKSTKSIHHGFEPVIHIICAV